jgi:menaquinone-dependent protoporphyrinogen oxidase
MGRVLVVYGTKSGCTRTVAERIGAELEKGGMSIGISAAHDAVLTADHAAVVVGSGVRMGKWHAAVRTWVGDHGAILRAIPVAFYTVGLRITEAGRTEEVRAYTDPLIQDTGVRPVGLGLFAGWNVLERFPFLERLILKAMKAPEGDFRDWNAIDAWTAEIRHRLGNRT